MCTHYCPLAEFYAVRCRIKHCCLHALLSFSGGQAGSGAVRGSAEESSLPVVLVDSPNPGEHQLHVFVILCGQRKQRKILFFHSTLDCSLFFIALKTESHSERHPKK